MRQLVDWRAAVIAGVIAGAVFLALEMLLTARAVGSPWVFVRLVAAMVLGRGVLPPPATFDGGVLAAALAVHIPISIASGCLIAFVIHRGGLVAGVLIGALLGVALYAINYWSLSYFFPWFFPMKSSITLLAHLAFGAVAGGVYELLEVERFVKAEA